MKNSRVRLCMSSVFAIILYIVLQELVLSFHLYIWYSLKNEK